MLSTLYIIEVVIGLGLTIAIHEFGHFLAAKLSGVRVDKFAIGFGPAILKFQRGETEYSLRIIPLGGFVSMPGETHGAEGADDPRALVKQPVHRRAIIFSAGVAMNIVLAIVFFAIAFPLGVEQTAPYVGAVLPDSPAEAGGIKAGDHILEINRTKVESFEDVMYQVGMSDPGTAFDFVMQRTTDDGTMKRVNLPGIRSVRTELMPTVGIQRQIDTRLKTVEEGTEAWKVGVRAGDRLVAIDGRTVGYWEEADRILEEKGTSPMTLTIMRDGKEMLLEVKPAEIKHYTAGFEQAIVVEGFLPKSPARDAGIKEGDVIFAVDANEWPTLDEVREATKAAEETGVLLEVLRSGEKKDFRIVPQVMPESRGLMMGIKMSAARAVVGPVDKDGPAAGKLQPGDVVIRLNQTKVRDISDILAFLITPKETEGAPVMNLVVVRGDKEVSVAVEPTPVPVERLTLAGATLSGPVQVTLRADNPAQAIAMGVTRTWQWVKNTYLHIKQTIVGNISPQASGGPVLIATAAYSLAAKGLGTLLWFFAIINACIAVINFLPIPVLDGGHMAFLVIEKIKGKPLSPRVQAVATTIGLTLILAFFLLITYKDILWLLR